MSRIWLVALVLITVVWWSLPPVAAAKIEHFKDNQGTLHISNVGPEDQAKPASAPADQVSPAPMSPPPPMSRHRSAEAAASPPRPFIPAPQIMPDPPEAHQRQAPEE